MIRKNYKLTNFQGSMAELADTLRNLGSEQGWSDKCVYQITLSLDEIITNILQYGYQSTDAHEIDVTVEINEQQARLEVRDNARPFNPVADISEPELDKPLLERKRCVGGMGVHLVKSIMNSIDYRYEDGRNFLTMEKDLDSLCDAEKCHNPVRMPLPPSGE
ncbi:ATP-binding protein [Desulfonatronum parangueonense]